MLSDENERAGDGLATGDVDLAIDGSSKGADSSDCIDGVSSGPTVGSSVGGLTCGSGIEAGGGGEEACTAGGNSGSGTEAGGSSMSIRIPAGGDLLKPPRRKGLKSVSSGAIPIRTPAAGDLLKPPPRKGLKSASSGTGAATGRDAGLEGVLLAGDVIPPGACLSDPEPGVASPGRVGVGASLTIRLVAKRAASVSEGLSKLNCAESRLLGSFVGDLDLRRSKASGLCRDMLALVGDA